MNASKILNALFLALLLSTQIHAEDKLRKKSNTFFGKIPASMPGSENDTAEQIKLGERLYFETALSVNRAQSCNTCHNILEGGAGTDGLKVAKGALGTSGVRNTPSTWNAGFQFVQNWDGSAKTLEAQARDPILSPIEMGLGSEKTAIKRLTKAKYKKVFKKAFPESSPALSFENITRALAAFQRTLVTQDRFDQYLAGDDSALNKQEQQGLSLFFNKGCIACHSGHMMGGQLFMKMGLVKPYPNTQDKGKGDTTGKAHDEFMFKVPQLRNVAQTAPFFHDGAGKNLEQAVLDTGWHQLGVRLNDSEVADLSAFLRTLSNTRPYIKQEQGHQVKNKKGVGDKR